MIVSGEERLREDAHAETPRDWPLPSLTMALFPIGLESTDYNKSQGYVINTLATRLPPGFKFQSLQEVSGECSQAKMHSSMM